MAPYGYRDDINIFSAPDDGEIFLTHLRGYKHFQLVDTENNRYYLGNHYAYRKQDINLGYFIKDDKQLIHLVLFKTIEAHRDWKYDTGKRTTREDWVDGSRHTVSYKEKVGSYEEQFSDFKSKFPAELYFATPSEYHAFNNVIKDIIVIKDTESSRDREHSAILVQKAIEDLGFRFVIVFNVDGVEKEVEIDISKYTDPEYLSKIQNTL